VSRDGRRVAFLDHANRGDNQAALMVVDTRKAVRELAPNASNGLAWSAAGDAVLFPTGQALREATLSGRRRVVFRSMGGLFLHDVAAQGQVLVSRLNMQREIVAQAADEGRPRNLSWLDWSFPTALSEDGSSVLFEEQNLVTAGDYALFLRPTDGSPPVRLGEGCGLALSPDGRWVLAARTSGESSELVLLPTGAGEMRRLGPAAVVAEAAAFLPDGARIVLGGHAPGEGGRLYVMNLDGTGLRPISPEGVTAYFCALASPDGTHAFATGPDGVLTLYPIAGGEPRRVPGTSLEDVAIRWAAGGRALFVQRRTGLPARVERVDVATGAREPWLELTPPDPAGVHGIGPIHLSSDGRTAVYSYRRKLDQLFVVEGLR
jgi:dipeptidyl aminopeptidase/acylaminoacyl peptidase